MLSVSRTDCQREEARKCWKEREKFAPCELGEKKKVEAPSVTVRQGATLPDGGDPV